MRERFKKLLETERDQFDEEDINRVNEKDFFVKRFLLARKRNVDAAFKMIVGTLKWIKREKFRRTPANACPVELYFIGAIFDYEKDLEGNYTIYFRVRYVLRFGPLVPHAVKWASKFFYDLDGRLECAFYTVIIDFSGCGLKNAEVEFIWHAINISRTYVPTCLRRILAVDLLKVFKFGWHIIKSIIPESERSLLIFIRRQDLVKYVAKANTPDFLVGTCTRKYHGPSMVPLGFPTAIEYGLRKGVPLDQCFKVSKIYEPIIKEYHLFNVDEKEGILSRVENELVCRKEGKPLETPALDILTTAET